MVSAIVFPFLLVNCGGVIPSSGEMVPRAYRPVKQGKDVGKALLYNIYHPCATESLRFSFSRFFCAMAILLCSRAFSSSPTLASSNGFLVTTMV